MGKRVVYCTKCGQRLREEEFKTGRGFSILNRYSCIECKDLQIASLSPEEKEQYQRSLPHSPQSTPVPPEPRTKDRPGSSSTMLRPIKNETGGMPAMSVPAAGSSQSESKLMRRMTPQPEMTSPSPGHAPTPAPPPPSAAPSSAPMSSKTPQPRPLRRPSQTSRPFAPTKQKGNPAAAWIVVAAILGVLFLVLIIVLASK